jgi:hypothetical protein
MNKNETLMMGSEKRRKITKKTYTALFAAKSSPLLIVVPTAINCLLPVSVEDILRVTTVTALTVSLVANFYLYECHVSVRKEKKGR